MNTPADKRDHGGNLDEAMRRYGGHNWIDLSTGINRRPWPIPSLPARAWTDLPTAADKERLMAAARHAYATSAPGLAVAGAQAAIQLVPQLRDIGLARGLARILGPTYNEHAAALTVGGWRVEMVENLSALDGADLAVVVNPNNPGGEHHPAERLQALEDQVGTLVVDESFGDARPELSLASRADRTDLIVMRSFGKFYGLAGLRLGFLFADAATVAKARSLSGPWPVSGVAIDIGSQAFADVNWQRQTIERLRADAERLDRLARQCAWQLIGGTELFRTYATPDAAAINDALARSHIWTRRFPWSTTVLRLGLPGNDTEWARLTRALNDLATSQSSAMD